MRTLIYVPFLLMSLFCVCNLQGQMRQIHVDAADADNEARKFSFYSSSEGYVAFAKWIGFTTDSGHTFTRKNISIGNVDFNGYPVNLTFGFSIKGVKAFSQDSVIVYGHYGFVPSILYSTDKGNSFKLVYHDRYDPFAFKTGITDLVFPQSGNTGYAVDADRILKTTNKGFSWFVVRQDVNRYFDFLEAVDNTTLFAFSTQYTSNKLFKSSNGGSTWTQLTVPPGRISYVQFLTVTKGWAIMADDFYRGSVYYTSDGGRSWTQKNDPYAASFYGIKFRFIDDSTGYLLDGSFNVYKTTDSGKVWQALPRDNNFSHNSGHVDMQVLNKNQLWAGGGHAFIEMTTNGGGTPQPKAFFKVDTSGVEASGIVNLINLSKPIYQYRWFKNDTLISTVYHASFSHYKYKFRDTIKLVVSDGEHSDTAVHFINYPSVWITGFTPTSAAHGMTVTITGYNFTGAYEVSFGGARAGSFSVISSSQINAVVSGGSSGLVQVSTPNGVASMLGFTYLDAPNINLPVNISDSILCKSERITVTIENAEAGVLYELWDHSRLNVYGQVTGNGGMASLVSLPIAQGGRYLLSARRPQTTGLYYFTNYINIRVENTQARFVADLVNITPGEAVTYTAQAGDARDFFWSFYGDASIATASGVKSPAISYGSIGNKPLRLIAVSQDGCRDTTIANAVFVYSASAPNRTCFINTLDTAGLINIDLLKVLPGKDDAIYAIGTTPGGGKLNSSLGVSKAFASGQQGFFAKYTTEGVLKWVHQFKENGRITAGQTDANGNIYLAGVCWSKAWFYFNNGDSMRFYHEPRDTVLFSERWHGFIMKLDPDGKFLWYTLMYDHSPAYLASAGERCFVTGIAVKGDQIAMLGNFNAKLSYSHNGSLQQLYDFGYHNGANYLSFLIRITPGGSLLWSSHIINGTAYQPEASDVDIDKNGNSYVTGFYGSKATVYDADGVERVFYHDVSGGYRAYLVKYDALGNIAWHNHFNINSLYGDITLSDVVADDAGNTYVAGGVNRGLEIKHSSGIVSQYDLKGLSIVKFNPEGIARWAVGSRYPQYGDGFNLYLKTNEIYATGRLLNDREALSQFVITSADGKNRTLVTGPSVAFVLQYDTSGNYKRVFTTGFNERVHGLSVNSIFANSQGHFIVGGAPDSYFGGIISSIFDVAWPQTHISGGSFFAKLNPDFCQSALSADAGPDINGCVGDTVSIGTKATGNYYSWTSNPTGFTSNLSSPLPKPLVNTSYYLKVTNDKGETAYDTVLVTLRPAPFADAGPDTTICANSFVQIGTPALPGHTYEWFSPLPEPMQSTQPQVYVTTAYGNKYHLRVIGPNGCPAFDTITISAIPKSNPMVGIETPATTVCKDAVVNFTSVSQELGIAPVYQWEVNGIPSGTNSDRFSTNTLKNGDRVSLTVTHNSQCAQGPKVYSNSIFIKVTDKVHPTVAISGNTTVTEGDKTVITATVSDAGNSFHLKWQDSTSMHTWQDLTETLPANSYEYKPQKSGDKLRCVLTVSNLCVNSNVILGTGLSFIVNKVTGIEPLPASQYGLRYYPNPTPNLLIIDSLRMQDQWQKLNISSIDGRQIFLSLNVSNRTIVKVPVEGLGKGMYVAILRNRKGVTVYLKFIKL